jgi:KDO2-lipid IV(A) lauroyltransferase
MHKVLYGILKLLLKGVARLPFGALYALSDVTYFLLCHTIGYRRKVIIDNLRKSFPDKSEEELVKISRDFYRNFTDYIFETIKLLHISDEEMMRHMTFEGLEPIDQLLSEGKSVIAYFSHSFNWEWVTSVALHSKHHGSQNTIFGQVYRPLRNKIFDQLMLEVRSRFGTHSFAKAMVLRDMLKLKRAGIASLDGFMSDQKPSHGDPTHVTMFLNQPTAFISGTETLARKLDMGVAYIDMYKPRRGYYRVVFRLLADDIAKTKPGEVTERYAHLLEETIRRDPALWLWSHKRWKIPVTLPQSNQE